MYAANVSKILNDVTIPQKLVNKVLRENNMEIVRKFSPVNSEYQFMMGNNKRITMTLTEDEFIQKEERFVRNQWRPSVEMRLNGANRNLEDVLIQSISEIMELGERFKNYRIIK